MKIKSEGLVSQVIALLAVVVVLVVEFSGFLIYSAVIRNKIYEANARQLTELYRTVSTHFVKQSDSNYKYLATIQAIFEMTDESAYRLYIEQAEVAWGCSYFYFLDEAGNYFAVDGETGHFDLDDHYRYAVSTGMNVLKMSVLPNVGDVALYITPVKPASYHGFSYCALALAYDRAAMENSLNVALYASTADTFVIGNDGRIVITDASLPDANIYTVLNDDLTFEYATLEDLKKAIQVSGNWSGMIQTDDGNYYVVLVGMEHNDWMMLGILPESAVSGSMTGVQEFTMAFTGGLLLLIGITVVGLILYQSIRSVQEKDLQLRYREQLFDVLSSQTDEVFVMFAPESAAVEYISPNVERVMGTPCDRAQKNLFSIRPIASQSEQCEFMEHLASLPLGTPEYLEWSRENPQTRQVQWFSETLLRVGIDGGERFVVVISDISKEVENRQQLREALNIAEAANLAKSSFLSNMSHDIRTPMNAITGFCLLLEKDAANPERILEHTKKIRASSSHLLGLINDVLDMSKIESGKTTLNLNEFALNEWIGELNVLIHPQAKAKEQRFSIHVSDLVHETVVGDKLRLNQIMLNILSNAVKYTPAKGTISFSIQELSQTSPHMARYRFTVADNGIGMSEEYQKIIFDPFTREVNTKVNKIQGTGLGMAITKHLVDLMGGMIHISSEIGKGTTFTVEISLRIVERRADPDFWAFHGIGRVLVADDDMRICASVLSALSGSGVEAKTASDTHAVLQLAESEQKRGRKFDLVLMDWNLPEEGGLAAARELHRRISEELPIFMMTAYDFEEMEEALEGENISGFLQKPFFMANFKSAIEKLRTGEAESTDRTEKRNNNRLKGMHFLVAEDNELNAEILLELLDMLGASGEVCENGEEVATRFFNMKQGEFDAILMDVQMPVMNGYEATRAIRNSGLPSSKTIPIIAMTANAFDEDVRDALAAGMNAHISKPVNMDHLQEVIMQLVAMP